MVKTLRKRFILVAILVVTVVIGGIVGGINIANYSRVNADASKVMNVLVSNGGKMPIP